MLFRRCLYLQLVLNLLHISTTVANVSNSTNATEIGLVLQNIDISLNNSEVPDLLKYNLVRHHHDDNLDEPNDSSSHDFNDSSSSSHGDSNDSSSSHGDSNDSLSSHGDFNDTSGVTNETSLDNEVGNSADNLNETVHDLANITADPLVLQEHSEDPAGPSIGATESAIILAATFLILAAIGYGGMITWRRILQVRYGTSEMLITDDVYDITDLRNFEI